MDEGAVENGPGDKKEGKRTEAPHTNSGPGVLKKKRIFVCVIFVVLDEQLLGPTHD